MREFKKDMTPLLTHWNYVFLALTHRKVDYVHNIHTRKLRHVCVGIDMYVHYVNLNRWYAVVRDTDRNRILSWILQNRSWNNCDYWSAFRNFHCYAVNIARYRYNAVNFLEKYHKRHPLARTLGRNMGCILWVQTLIYTLTQSRQWCV